MKKYFLGLLIFAGFFVLIGCTKQGEKDILKEISNKIEKSKGYYLNGELEVINNEDSYLYDVEVSFQKENKFRVSLKNKTNNHEQIILRNDEGVYVLTPSLNKSFKFQSDWPYNNSQAYILQTMIKDINGDENRVFEETEDYYIFSTKVNYPNNNDLSKQKVLIDKNLNIKEISIYNSNDEIQMKMIFNSIDYKATYDDTYFTLKGNMSNIETKSTSNTIDSIIYPMYIPENTKLSSQEKVATENGERIILTFSGDNPFMIIQETALAQEELLTIPMFGEPFIITGTVGALSEDSITWINNGVEFYVVSDTLSSEQLLEVANSINTINVSK